MNGFERYCAVLRGERADQVPRTPILMQFAAEYCGADYAAFAADYQTLVEANLVCAMDFDFDQVSCISDPYRETQGFGAEIEYMPDGPPRSTHPLQENRNFAKLLRPDPLRSERMLDRVKAVEEFKKQAGGQYSILGWVEGPAAEAADLRDVTNFMMDLMDDEAYAGDLMDLCLATAIDFARVQVAAGADTIGIGDAVASQMSPGIYEKLIQPREKQLVNAIQDMGAWAKLHICGNITHLLPAIADLQVDVLDLDHMVDLAEARRVVGPRVTLAGNVDPVAVVRNGTPAVIREAVQRAHAAAGNPFLVNAGCEIPSGTPVVNLKALCAPLAV
ncbi:MAG: uroporphyrinogen decarboxylase family protein [Kiritimatiellia bacterium]|nr:uroporphyrinogen decarboxylase family protein [Lentisphaerota bacterium]